ncbi:MAG: hypothetical protein ACTSYD_08665 [Candidatus Heimdallarchaeaceae archaeon]
MSETKAVTKKVSESEGVTPRGFFEVWKDWFIAFGKYLGRKFHSPLGIWMFSVWLTSDVIMGITNTLRGETFWDGPNYWLYVFMTYGLNAGQSPDELFISKPVLSWIFAPMIVLNLAIILYVLPASGYFRNGAFPIEQEDLKKSSMFFNAKDIWGSELINPNHPKWTMTYLWIMFMPIFLGTLLAAIYNYIVFKLIKKQKYLPSAKNVLLVSFFACLFTGLEMALLSGDITFQFSKFFKSLFVERKNNQFLVYGLQYGESGQYHPISLAFSMWLINLIPFFFVYGIFLFVGNIKTIVENLDLPYRKLKDYIEARREPVATFMHDFDEVESKESLKSK